MGIKFNIIRAQPEHIIPILEVRGRAFQNDLMQAAMFPPRLASLDDAEEQHRFRAKILRDGLEIKGTHLMAAVANDESQRVLGYAGWVEPGLDVTSRMIGLPPDDKQKKTDGVDDEQARQGEIKAEVGEGTVDDGQGGRRGDGKTFPSCLDVGALLRVKRLLEEAKKEILGEEETKVWYLGSLGVDPNLAGQGIASRLVQWGIDRAEEWRSSAYLESTPAALRVYRKLGFVEVKKVKVLEGNVDHALTVFIKRPKGLKQ